MRPNILTLLLAFFTVTIATAQLYDNRARYLRTPHDVDRFERTIYEQRKPIKSTYRSTPTRSSSYSNYRSRISKYARPSYDSREFYERYRKPGIFDKYNDNWYLAEGGNNPDNGNIERPKFEFKCFCFVPIDLYSLYSYFTSQKSAIEKARQDFIDGQEEEYLKEMNERAFGFNDNNFKDAQSRFFKSYIKKYGYWYEGGRKMSYGNHRERLLKDLKENSEKFDRVFERRLALSTVISNLKHYKRTDKSNLKKHFGDLTRGGKFVRDIPESHFQYYDFYNSMLMSGNKWGLNLFHIRDVYNYFKYNPNDLMSDYLVDKYINQYNNENDLKKRFSLQSAYLIDELNGSYRIPSNKTPPVGFMRYIPYNKNSILDFYKRRPDFISPNSIMSFEKAKAVMAIYNSFPKNISNYIQNNAYLKTSVIDYLKNATPTYEELNTIKEIIESKMNNEPFKWSNQLEYLRDWTYQEPSSPETIIKINLKASLPNWLRLREYGIKYSLGGTFDVMTFEFHMHNGIGNVLRNIYGNSSSWSTEGATIRHFLKEKGLNIPSSLSNRDLGTLFDFGGGNTNTLTIEFSDYAKKYITNFHHGDGIYGTSLFTDPFKLQALKEILKGNTVDFQNEIIIDPLFKPTKEYCVLQELTKMNNNLLKRVSNQFTQNKSQFRLKFTAYNNPSDHAHMRTGLNKESPNIVEIRLNLSKKGGRALDLASSILHEAIHAELHRIYLSGNKAPYNYSREHYAWLMDLYEFFQNDKNPANNAHHFFMAKLHIDPLTKALRDFDKQKHPLENYKYLAWDGLYDFGKAIGLINRKEFDRLGRLLSQTVYSDSYESNCN